MTGRNWLVFSLIFFLVFLYSGSTHAATINAASCSQSNVQSAVNSASRGDTVVVPAGNCTWTSNLSIGSKPITLEGAGVGQTNITHNASGNQDHLISFTEDATISTRITGFSFLNGGYNHRFIQCSGSYTSAPARIDHNAFNGVASDGTATGMLDLFSCRGLIDHNTFVAPNNSEQIHNWGPSPESGGSLAGWNTSVVPGSTNAIYIEDNTFHNSTSGDWGAQSAISNFDAAVIVARHNQFQNNQIDVHGGSNYGTRWYEFYENNFCTNPGYTQDKYFDIRAGSGVVFNNHHNGTGSLCTSTGNSNAAIIFRHETRSGDCSTQSPTGTGCWVGMGINQNKWSPAYAWGNDSSMSVQGGQDMVAGTNFISSSSQPSSMIRWEQSGDSCNPFPSNCTTYNYVPFTYPYPLDANGLPNPTQGGTTQPAPPTNLSVSVQ